MLAKIATTPIRRQHGAAGAGTIYIAADYDADLEFNPWNIVIDSEDLAEYDFGTDTYTYYFGDLVIQGGWDFDANEHPAGATTTFSYPLTVDWRSDITLNDLIFTAVSTGSHALTVTSNGDITLNRVDMDNNDSTGALLDTCLDDDAESLPGARKHRGKRQQLQSPIRRDPHVLQSYRAGGTERREHHAEPRGGLEQ